MPETASNLHSCAESFKHFTKCKNRGNRVHCHGIWLERHRGWEFCLYQHIIVSERGGKKEKYRSLQRIERNNTTETVVVPNKPDDEEGSNEEEGIAVKGDDREQEVSGSGGHEAVIQKSGTNYDDWNDDRNIKDTKEERIMDLVNTE